MIGSGRVGEEVGAERYFLRFDPGPAGHRQRLRAALARPDDGSPTSQAGGQRAVSPLFTLGFRFGGGFGLN